jgi:Ca-activated chloride channel family protein
MAGMVAVLTAPSGAAAQAPTFSSGVEAVRVDVLVTDRGKPLRGLQRDDFEVLDNGVPQVVDLVIFEQLPVNAILCFDMSDSVAGERMAHLREAGIAVLDALTPSDQVALVTFNQMVVLAHAPTSDFASVRRALGRGKAFGHTALVDAAHAGMLLGEADVGRALVIVFSDGVDTASWLTPQAVLETARRSDVVVYGVTAGNAGAAPFLRQLARTTGGSLFEIASTRDLAGAFLRVLDEFRQRYLISYSPRGVSPDGWHRLDVRVKRRSATVHARPGYLAGK